MLAYGYQWDSEAERPEELREVSLACTREELDRMIEMLASFRDGAQAGDHRHFRDWSGDWEVGQSDFIVLFTERPRTKRSHG